MTATLDQIYTQVMELKRELEVQLAQRKVGAQQIQVSEGLSDISERMGLLQAGEFRTGNGQAPGHGFTGVRIGYPAFSYSGGLWHVAGVALDVLQVGINAEDGKLYAGQGNVVISEDGIRLYAGSAYNGARNIIFVDENGDVLSDLYTINQPTSATFHLWVNQNNIKTTGQVIIRAEGSTSYASYGAANGGADQASLVVSYDPADARGIGAAVAQLNGTGLLVDVTSHVIINENGNDVDVRIEGDTATQLFKTDGGLNAVQIGTTTAGNIMDARSTGTVWNEDGEDRDFRIESNDNANMFKVDAGNNTVAIGGGAGVTLVDEGTFVPTIVGTTTAGAGTYTLQLARYQLFGYWVFFNIVVTWTAHTGTGNMRVSGLPYTAANDNIDTPVTFDWSNITLAAAGNKLEGLVLANTIDISLREVGGGAAAPVPIDTSAVLRVSGFYRRA